MKILSRCSLRLRGENYSEKKAFKNIENSFNLGKLVCTSNRLWVSCSVFGSFEIMTTDNGRFIKVSCILPLGFARGYEVSLIMIFLFLSSAMNGSSGTHCSGGKTPRDEIVPSTTICAIIDVGNAVVRIIDVIFTVSS